MSIFQLNISWPSQIHPSQKLWPFEFAESFRVQIWGSRYNTGLNRTFELNVVVVWICSELWFSISSVSIYYETQSNVWVKNYCRLNFLSAFVINCEILSDIQVKSYCRFNLLKPSVFNYERLDILRDSFGHLSKTLLSLKLLRGSVFNFERLDILQDSIGHPS